MRKTLFIQSDYHRQYQGKSDASGIAFAYLNHFVANIISNDSHPVSAYIRINNFGDFTLIISEAKVFSDDFILKFNIK